MNSLVEWLRDWAQGANGPPTMHKAWQAAARIEAQEKALREIVEDVSEAIVHLDEARSATGMDVIKDVLATARAALKEGE